jgi:hypothetical protein
MEWQMTFSEFDALVRADKIPWCKALGTGEYDLFLDNHMMQTFRACPQRFKYEFVDGLSPKGKDGAGFWFLDFGIVFHAAMEYYYPNLERCSTPEGGAHFIQQYLPELWNMAAMTEKYSEDDRCKKLGGLRGFQQLLAAYITLYNRSTERFRVVGSEIAFGRDKQVPLGVVDYELGDTLVKFNVYLSGKLDLLVDNGNEICPLDHKTARNFGGKNPLENYEIADGMTGYVYATNAIVQNMGLEKQGVPLRCNKILMNFAQVEPPAKGSLERFKRLPLYKTDWQLSQYQDRMMHTVGEIMVHITRGDEVWFFNDRSCKHWMFSTCMFYEMDRAGSYDQLVNIKTQMFDSGQYWNPERESE